MDLSEFTAIRYALEPAAQALREWLAHWKEEDKDREELHLLYTQLESGEVQPGPKLVVTATNEQNEALWLHTRNGKPLSLEERDRIIAPLLPEPPQEDAKVGPVSDWIALSREAARWLQGVGKLVEAARIEKELKNISDAKELCEQCYLVDNSTGIRSCEKDRQEAVGRIIEVIEAVLLDVPGHVDGLLETVRGKTEVAGEEVPGQRKGSETAKQANSPEVAGESDKETSDKLKKTVLKKGVSLQDAAACICPDKPARQRMKVKKWRNSKTCTLPIALGKDCNNKSRNLYDVESLIGFLRNIEIEGEFVESDFSLRTGLNRVKRSIA